MFIKQGVIMAMFNELSDKLTGWRDQIAARPTVTNSASANSGDPACAEPYSPGPAKASM